MALAARGVRAEKTTLDEDPDARAWKLKLTIDHGSTPDRDVVPMVFSFKQTATYERSLTDESPDKPVQRTVPMTNQVATNSEQEVAFSDPGTGKRFNATKFPITLRRKEDFEAGEYELTVKVVGGQTIGSVRLQLKGDNKPIDRRSLSFSPSAAGGAKKKAEPEAKAAEAAPKGGAAEDQGPDLSNIPDASKSSGTSRSSEPAAPPPVPPKQGGCGCHLVGEVSHTDSYAVAALGVAAFAAASRRRRLGVSAPR
jgi:uncharacterized protein (TIGR03382 family)